MIHGFTKKGSNMRSNLTDINESTPNPFAPKYRITSKRFNADVHGFPSNLCKYICICKKNVLLYRIEALRDIPRHGVKKGDIGGYIESNKNLRQHGDCWIGMNAMVFGEASIHDNALIDGNLLIDNDIQIGGNNHITHHNRNILHSLSSFYSNQEQISRLTIHNQIWA